VEVLALGLAVARVTSVLVARATAAWWRAGVGVVARSSSALVGARHRRSWRGHVASVAPELGLVVRLPS